MPELQVKEVESVTVMSLSFTGSYTQTPAKLDELRSWLLRSGHPYSAPPIGVFYEDPAKVAEDQLRAEVCLPIEEDCEASDDVERKKLAGGTFVCLLHEGLIADPSPIYQEIWAWMAENGHIYAEGQPCREVYRHTYTDEGEMIQAATEFQVPIQTG